MAPLSGLAADSIDPHIQFEEGDAQVWPGLLAEQLAGGVLVGEQRSSEPEYQLLLASHIHHKPVRAWLTN